MTAVGTAAAWLLAAVLAWAGAAKLRRPAGTAVAFAELAVPAPRLLARVVPAWELALALALPLRPAVAGAAALATLVGFTVLLAARLRQGTAATCGCFGSARTAPVSAVEVVRNGLLGALALLALAAARPLAPGPDALVAVGAAAAAGAVLVALLELRRATGRLWDNRLSTGSRDLR
ncbi:MAG TPA: MauE/DoxX family redox-associated membrane protein [Egibacteraceae bacterium]|nr:MauE/DoxX family redox-associated membrane protein [Egibacteraceae bacterium]